MRRVPGRVLMTADAVGGVWTYALELARGLSSRGVEVLLAVMGEGVTSAKRKEAEGIAGLRLEVSDFKLEWMDEPWFDVEQAGDWLLASAEAFQPDIVHLNGYAHASLNWDAPSVVVAHSCVQSWFAAVRGGRATGKWDIYTERVKSGIHNASFVVAPSQAMLTEFFRHYGAVRNARVIYNGRDPESFHASPKEPFILSAGRVWDDAKNFGVLAEACPGIDWPIFVAGERSQPGGGVADFEGLRLLGNLDAVQLAEWYARAAIYALPALYEPFGLTALEAALSGCSLVLSDIPSLREIWEDAAVYVAPRDISAWRDRLNRLAHEPEERERLASTARTKALQLSTTAQLEQYLEVYEQARIYRSCESFSSVIPFDPTGITGTPISSAA